MAVPKDPSTATRATDLNVTGPDLSVTHPAGALTIRAVLDWLTAGRDPATLIDWAPDVAAATNVLLERSHAFRFVVSPPPGGTWPPAGDLPFAELVADAVADWLRAMDDGAGTAPRVVADAWQVVLDHLDTPVHELGDGQPWRLCEAVLLVHAIADEAAAGTSGGGSGGAAGVVHRARARELLTRHGSMARLPSDRIARLPKTRTTAVGITNRSLSRYSCTTVDGVTAHWFRAPIRRPGTEPAAHHANVLLLPWPLHIRESDFVPVPGSVRRPEREPFGFFAYEPSEGIDLGLVDRLLTGALDEVDVVDVVVLPEGCLAEDDIPGFEAMLARHNVRVLVSGIRPRPTAPDRFPGNCLHMGVRLGGQWWHYRQNKHHRWFLDAGQIETYNIAGALHPGVKWWEAMDIPQRSVSFLELGGGITIAAVVCEDLARLDGVAQLLRSVGPTLVVTLLLDGPQLASRWTSRYAGVLADDPGSAVLTLTAFGMTARSRPNGMPASPVVAMWKDPERGLREIPLEGGAQGVLLKAMIGRAPRHAADGRAPVDDATDLYVAGVHQLRVPDADPHPTTPEPSADAVGAPLDVDELSVLCSWAEATAEAIGHGAPGAAPAAVKDVLDEALAPAPWRSAMGLPEPSDELGDALAILGRLTTDALARAAEPTLPGVLTALTEGPGDETPRGRLVYSVLRRALDTAPMA